MLRGEYIIPRHAYIAGQEPGIFHCHHYNTYLQAVIEDASSYLDVYSVLIESAQEVAYSQFFLHFTESGVSSVEDRKKVVEDYFKFCGFGLIDLSEVSETGGTVTAISDHYGIGWKSKFGQRVKDKKGVSFFSLGYIIGALEAIYSLTNGSLTGEQIQCIAKGDSESKFSIDTVAPANILSGSPREGQFQEGTYNPHHSNHMNTLAIRDAVLGMPLQGNDQDGLIDAFGVLLTRMYANYYCLISYKFLGLFEKEMAEDGIKLASELLVEAGHVCAFNTFGGIMQSAEWNALIKPMILSQEDWVRGIVAVINAFGWGIWEIENLEPGKKLEIKITSGYEANSFLEKYDNTSIPISFLATGGVAGIMNLVYATSLIDEPLSLTEDTYKELKSGKHFTATQTSCRALGDEFDYFVAEIK